MRNLIAIVVLALTLALAVCAIIARRSRKTNASSVALLLGALIPPVIGNLIIISSTSKGLSTVGCYIYFLGMDLVMFALLEFTLKYCDLSWPSKTVQRLVYSLLVIDGIQLLCNPLFHHAFDTELIMVDGDTDAVLGYAMFSRFHLEEKYEDALLLLSPVAVKTELQRQHISKELIEYGFEKAAQMGYQAVIVEGNPVNYRSRGFVTSCDFGIVAHESVGLPAPECLMVKALVPGALEHTHGTVSYHDYDALR